MSTANVLFSQRGGVAIIHLHRPERMNAWTAALQRELFDVMERCDRNPSVHAIVLTGSGHAFCAGADLDVLDGLASGRPDATVQQDEAGQRDLLLLRRLSKPVVAAVNGAAAGIGLCLALACDIRFANRDAKLCSAFSKRGLVAEYGSSFLLPRLVGTGGAMLLLLSSEVVRGDEAHRIGLVQRCCDGDAFEQAVAFCTKLAEGTSPASLAVIKRQVWAHPQLTEDEAMRQTNALMRASISPGNADFAEGVRSFVEKRRPAFAPLNAENPAVAMRDALAVESKL